MNYNQEFSDKIENSDLYKDYMSQIKKAPQQTGSPYNNEIINKTEEDSNILELKSNWGTPIAFDKIEIPEFPLEAYPEKISNYPKDLSISTQTAPEMAGILMLGVLAICNQGKYKVKINSTYSEPLSLYVTAVAEPGERKSAVIQALTSPIKKFQFEFNEAHNSEIKQSISTYRGLKKKNEEAEKNFAKVKISLEELNQTALECENFCPKHFLKLFVDNATTEKLIDLMQEQGGKISIISAEGGIFKNFGSDYKKNVDIDPYLKAHDGDSISFDRIGREANSIGSPALSMVITTQPKRINKFIKSEDYRECGLVARFLIVFCASRQGSRDVNPPSIPEKSTENYTELIKHMLKRTAKNLDLTLSEEAFEEYLGFQNKIEKGLLNNWHFMRDFAGKAPGTMLRIAGVLHCAEFNRPEFEKISLQTIKSAILITEFLLKHTQKAYQSNGANEKFENAKYILKQIKNLSGFEINKQDIYQHCKGKIKKAEDLDTCLEFLQKNNYLKIVSEPTLGRPKEKIILNPEY